MKTILALWRGDTGIFNLIKNVHLLQQGVVPGILTPNSTQVFTVTPITHIRTNSGIVYKN